MAKIDAAEGRWLTNKVWIAILLSGILFSLTSAGLYYDLKAQDQIMRTDHRLFKVEITGKLNRIIVQLENTNSKCKGKIDGTNTTARIR